MDSLDACENILDKAGQPLHYKIITDQIIEKELWHTEGKTPDQTVNACTAPLVILRLIINWKGEK